MSAALAMNAPLVRLADHHRRPGGAVQRVLARAALRGGELLTADEVVELLPAVGLGAGDWVRCSVAPAGRLIDHDLYRWSDVVAALELGLEPSQHEAGSRRWVSPLEAAGIIGVPVRELRELARMAPTELTGAPIPVGHGSERSHFRFDAELLERWWSEAREWRASTGQRARGASRSQGQARQRRAVEPKGAGVDWQGIVRDLGREARVARERGGRSERGAEQ